MLSSRIPMQTLAWSAAFAAALATGAPQAFAALDQNAAVNANAQSNAVSIIGAGSTNNVEMKQKCSRTLLGISFCNQSETSTADSRTQVDADTKSKAKNRINIRQRRGF